MPLDKLPRQQLRESLAHYAVVLRLCAEAARRDHCDWEMPPLTLKTLAHPPVDDVQSFRELAHHLGLRCRLELAEGQFDQAVRTLQIGFALARHVSAGENVIHNLVGVAIASVMLARVEEMIQLPGSPNLYWA